MNLHLIPANEYRRERWKNGLGWTREILRWPEENGGWDWRVSIAEVDKPGAFSRFEGCDRELVLLAGEGMRLNFADDGSSIDLLPPHGRHRFSGERDLSADLLAGPTQDFNLIWRRDRIEATLLHRPLVGPMVFFSEDRVCWIVHVLSGQAAFKDQLLPSRLEQGDSALIEPSAHNNNHRLILDGGGELLLIKLVERE
ncbi:MAG TPA: HutD family protein [Arenimonas sp.]|uniref:HutD/Ves family protein n=1 Tax=Arenimonas sp. TaxID=1872635 RepID=UPI002CC3C26D|nr:HutD family protein [Arenimonas sp.]HMB55911.1 HutD family protein [Arenimonas sp.]